MSSQPTKHSLGGPARLLPLGDAAVTVMLGGADDPGIHRRVHGFAAALARLAAAGSGDGIVEWTPGACSVTVHFDPLTADYDRLRRRLLGLADAPVAEPEAGRRWRLPVCFDQAFAIDLDSLAGETGMSAGTLAELVAATPLLVHMLGFLPGFAYMGDLPEVCRAARLATPRTRVPAGSVAVAGRLCAVYPWDSPGGWRIIGRTPLRLFDADNDVRPALLAAGDQVRWRPIDRREFDRVEADVRSGRFDAAELLDRDAAG